MNRFCVVNAEDSKLWDPVSFAQMFESGLKQDGDQWDVCELASGAQLPEDILDYCGVVITGSHYNTRDRDNLPWFEPLCDFIRKAAEVGSPKVYGGCFGCQIIAHALGGEVDYNPEKQFALKAENIKILPSFGKFLKGCCDDDKSTCMNIIVSHGECVVKLPPDAEQIGTSDSCVNEMYVAGSKRNIIGSQSHPEILDVKYCIHDRIAPVVIDQRKRLVGDQITESMDSFAKFTGDDSRKFLSSVSAFLHDNEIVKSRASKVEETDGGKSSAMASAATKLTSLVETAKAAANKTARTPAGLSKSASFAGSTTPATSAAARQAQMSETATRLALLANNIRGTPATSNFTSPDGSTRVSPSVQQRKTTALQVPTEGATVTTPVKSGESSPSTPTTRVSRVVRSAGKSKETVNQPTEGKQDSQLPELSPKSNASSATTSNSFTTSSSSSSSVGKDIMAEEVVVSGASATAAPYAATTTASPQRVFAPIVAEKIIVSPDTALEQPAAKASAPTTPAPTTPANGVDTNADSETAARRVPSKAGTTPSDPTSSGNSLVSYGTLSVLSLLFLGGLSFFMYRKWRR